MSSPTQMFSEQSLLRSLATERPSAPTKLKVKSFKNRVYSLLEIFVRSAKDPTPFLNAINIETITLEPTRMNNLILSCINKQVVGKAELEHIAQLYRDYLCYKATSLQKAAASGNLFVQCINKLYILDQQCAQSYIINMLNAFIKKRKCKLKAQFFIFLTRRAKWIKQMIKINAESIINQNNNYRPAQIKQLRKIITKVSKITKKPLKIQQE